MANRASRNRTGLKGVRKDRNGKFAASISVDGVTRHLGMFETVEAAGAAYDQAAHEAFGEFARPNQTLEKAA